MENMESMPSESNKLQWIKQKLQTVWTCAKFCGLCLENQGNFCSVDMELIINNQTFSKCLQDIVNYVFNDDIENLMSSPHLCDSCTEKIIQSYIFIHNTKQLSKILNNCVTDLYSKVFDVNEQLDCNVAYDNANVMIVLENDTELYKTIIDVKSMTEIVPTTRPIAMKQTVETSKQELYKNIIDVRSMTETVPTTRPITMEQTVATINCKQEPKVEDISIPKITAFNTVAIKKEIESPKVPQIKVRKVVKPNGAPNITLKGGHIVIKPLNSINSTTAPRYNTYECTDCPDIFTTYRSLKEHEKAKHKKSVYYCNLCDKSYTTQQYLNIHYKTHSRARCKLCQVVLPEEQLMDHLKTNHANLVHPCKFCDLAYYTKESLDTHFKISHLVNDKKPKSQCIMCLKNFTELEVLKNHKCKFSCSECFVMPCIHYKYLLSYREQLLSHANKVKCIDCDYVTRRKEHLIGHANREHLDHHPFICADCGQQFYTKLSLKTHIVQFHQEIFCQYCDFQFKDNSTLDNHRRACKTSVRAVACSQCVASFDTTEELTNHENLRHNEGVHACTLCKARFLTYIELEEHGAKVHSGIQCKKRRKHIECSICNIMFNNVKELLQHEKLHDPNDIYPCKQCKKQFKSLMKLYIHSQRHYTDRINCSGCNRKFATSFYAQHAVRCPYKRDVGLIHVCEVCGKGFCLESLLRFHQKSHMDPEPCPKCNKILKPSTLKRHMEQVHGDTGEKAKKQNAQSKSLACELCGHIVRKKCDLEAHMNRYHLKIKPFVCHICSKDFCGRVRLKEHIATHSTDNSCFCSVCGKKFANRVCLKMHFRIHTGEYPYACDICEQKFRSSSLMKTHRLKKHLERTVSCPLCDSMFFMARDMRHHFKKAHWQYKDGRPFNPREVAELSKEHYYLFEDGRLPKMKENE